MDTTLSAFNAMTDAELGKLVLFHADTSQRDEKTWELVTSEALISRSRKALRTMRTVNFLAQCKRREGFDAARAAQTGSRDSEGRLAIESEFAVWNARSERFAHRVSSALDELRGISIRRVAGTHDGLLRELLDAVDEHRKTVLGDDFEPTDHDELLWEAADTVADHLAASRA